MWIANFHNSPHDFSLFLEKLLSKLLMIDSFSFTNFPTSPLPIKLEKESTPSSPHDANDPSFELPLQKKRERKAILPSERKEKNRLSALAHRQRTRALMEELQESNKKLKETNHEQAILIATLQGQLHELRHLFSTLAPIIEAPRQEN